MEIKKWLKFILITATATGLTGCWDAKDINDRNIVTAVVVDKTDYGYSFTVEIPTIVGAQGGAESGAEQKNYVINAEGRSLVEARENIDKHMDKPLFLGAVQTIILTDRLASYDIEEYLMRLRQLNEYRKTVHVIVTTSDPDELLNSRPENSNSVGFSVDSTIMSLINTGQLQDVTMMDILEKFPSPYPRYMLPTIAAVENEPAFIGFTVFSGGVKTGFIPAADAKSIVLIQAKKAKLEYTVNYKDTYASVEVRVAKKKIQPHYSQNQVSATIDLKFKVTMMYPERHKPVSAEDIEEIGKSLKAMLEKDFEDTFRQSVEKYKYDCFNLNEAFRITYPNEYAKMNWADAYQNAKLYLNFSVDISPTHGMNYHTYD